MKSLRGRLLVGSVLWTIGLIGVTNLLTVSMILHRFAGPVVHIGAMALLALGLLIAGLVQLRSVLAPFRELQKGLSAVREGTSARVEGDFPVEVAPVVADLNALLDYRAKLVQRAIAKAGDLAHGLKTPLAVLGQESERLRDAGQDEASTLVGQQVERMRRQIDYHLAQARAAASGSTLGATCPVSASAEGLARTLTRLHAEKGVAIAVSVDASHIVRAQREDLDEMLGNLLDNACKWSRSQVRIESSQAASVVSVFIDDDGPGIPEDLRERVLQRGVRADEAAPGSGLGLAIVRDLAELHGGAITIGTSPLGGARAQLTLPSARESSMI